MTFDTITLVSDVGLADERVGVIHAVLHQMAPGVSVIDLAHEIEPHDVRAASLVLARSVGYLPPGIVVVGVDPGAGSDRRLLALSVADGNAVFVGPDNGVMAAAVAMIGGADSGVSLDDTEFHLDGSTGSDALRDILVPVAAHLCTGVPMASMGSPVDTATLVPGLMPVARWEDDGSVICEILWTDRFGRCQLNVDADDVEPFGPRVGISMSGTRRTALRVPSSAQLGTGEIGLVVDSSGLMSLVADRSSVAEELGLETGDEVILTEADAPTPVSTAVTIGASRGGETDQDTIQEQPS